MDALFAGLKAEWGQIDFLVHAIGFSDKNELRGRYVDTSRANFLMTMDISVYSFTAVCQRAAAIMAPGGSLLTLTSGDYGPKGTGATGVVWGLGGIVAGLLLAAIVAHGVRTLVVVVGGLGVVKELVARGEAGAPETERELHAARTQLRESGLPAAALWIVVGLVAIWKVVALTV